jgi:hypothetical protein
MMEQLAIKGPDDKWCPDTAKEWILFVRKIVNPLKKLCYEIHFVNDEQEYFEYVPQCLPDDSEFYNYLSKYRASKIVFKFSYKDRSAAVRAIEKAQQITYRAYKTADPSILAISTETTWESTLHHLEVSKAIVWLNQREEAGSKVIYEGYN